MIIEKLIELFNGSDLDAPAFSEIPKDHVPEEYYVIELIGDPMKNKIETATVVIRSYAKSMVRASDLAYDADNFMLNGAIMDDVISGITRNTIANVTDQSTKKYRYQGVYIITHY